MKLITKSLIYTVIFTVIFSFLVVGCGKKNSTKLGNEVLKNDNIVEVVTKIKDENTMSKEDIDMFVAGLARMQESGDTIQNKTVTQIVDLQKEFLRKASMTGLLSTASRIQMNLNLSVKFTQKLKIDNDTVQGDGLEFVMTNLSKTDITGIKGAIRVVNQQGALVKIRPINFDKILLKAGESKTQREVWPHNAENQYDVALRETKDLTAVWVVESITFSDGKKYTVAQETAKK